MNFYTNLSGYYKSNLYKFLLIMRLTMILLIAGMMQVSAGTYGQQITLNQKNISIRQIFKAVKKQTGYDILWQQDKLDANRKVNVSFNNTPLAQVIKECVAGQNMTFEIQDQSIVLKMVAKPALVEFLQDSVIFKGKITDENGKPMGGATVKIVGSGRSTFTTAKGTFAIYGPLKGTLEVSYIGYLNKQITLNGLNPLEIINVAMTSGENSLGEVNVVSTGYQDLAKERATGSFEVITKEQLKYSSDPNLIKRLEGITTSMNFNNNLTPINSAATRFGTTDPNSSPLANLTIRGKNTLNANQISPGNASGEVLVVIDGVASPYPIDNISPNDVESITVLKDAAAASIWGSRAANGVIVVKTKRGSYEAPLSVSFNSNFNVTDKINLFYKNVMTTSQYIDAQVFQFNAARTKVDPPTVGSPQPFMSPVAEILGKQQNGQITVNQANDQLDALRGNDVRKDFDKYILRDAFTQSYSIGIGGGSKRVAYRVSGNYDKNLQNTVGAGDDRISLGYNTSFRPLKNLEMNAGVNYSVRTSENQASEQVISAVIAVPYYPYTRLANDQGTPLSIPYKYRPDFIQLLSSTYGSKIQDLTFIPLQDMKEGYYKTSLKSLNFNLGANYKISKCLSASVLYNYNIGNNEQITFNSKNSFYVRDLVTYYTSTSGVQSIPNGALYRLGTNSSRSYSLRSQLNLNQGWGERHVLNAIAGVELTQNYSLSKSFRYYGYNDQTLFSNNQLDYKDLVPVLYDTGFGSTARIPTTSSIFSDIRIRTYSLYSNAAYTYNKRYTISGSVRKDMSSEFGIGTNKGGTPFYSFGGKWNIANEDFYKVDWLPVLQFRTTFGYNGNVNPVVSARPIISYSGGIQNNGLFSATTGSDATNNQLRPEKTGIINFGLDYGFKNGRISGSLEYYDKRTTDLIAGNAVDPSTGFNRLNFNTATLNGWGTDFTLNTQNILLNKFSWGSSLLFSYNRVKVVKLFTPAARTAADIVFGTPPYNVGADLSRLYAYRWAGLDPVTGSPRGYVNGQPVAVNDNNSYFAITGQPLATARYFGSASPVYFGSLRNTFRYGTLSVSFNILYKLGYYFRRPGNDLVNYSTLFNVNGGNAVQGAEYSQRWQNPGDELHTNVPSLIYPANSLRDLFYQYSEINVLKADHVRLQTISLSYSLSKKKWFLKNPQIYTNISNLGIIWRANKLGLDPDIADYPNPRTYAFGFSANF